MLYRMTILNAKKRCLLYLIRIITTLIFLSETRSIVLITNRDLSEWKEMKVDAHLVETLKARLMSDAQLIHLKKNN